MRQPISLQRILDEAEQRVAREGLDSLQMAELAKALKVKPPSLYKHVRDLQSIRVQLAQRGWNALSELFADLGRAGAEPRQLGRRWWRYAVEQPGAFEAAEAPALQAHPSVAAARARAEARAERIFENAGLTGDEAEHAWRALRVLVVGMNHLVRDTGGSKLPIEDSFSRALGALFRGWRRPAQG